VELPQNYQCLKRHLLSYFLGWMCGGLDFENHHKLWNAAHQCLLWPSDKECCIQEETKSDEYFSWIIRREETTFNTSAW
jgi:hypothetical protein